MGRKPPGHHLEDRRPVHAGRLSARVVSTLYIAWAAAVIGLVFVKDGATPDNVTHLLILGYLGASVLTIPWLRRLASRHSPRTVFIVFSLISAAFVEVSYMITAPLHPSLLIDAQTSVRAAFRNVGVDLALTLPAYWLIFEVIWFLARRYDYQSIEFTVLTSAGQAIGDGMSFLSASPAMLVFLPYLMVNYHAMTLVPFVALRNHIRNPGMQRGPMLVLLPLTLLPLVYGLAGTTIVLMGRAAGWIAQ